MWLRIFMALYLVNSAVKLYAMENNIDVRLREGLFIHSVVLHSGHPISVGVPRSIYSDCGTLKSDAIFRSEVRIIASLLCSATREQRQKVITDDSKLEKVYMRKYYDEENRPIKNCFDIEAVFRDRHGPTQHFLYVRSKYNDEKKEMSDFRTDLKVITCEE